MSQIKPSILNAAAAWIARRNQGIRVRFIENADEIPATELRENMLREQESYAVAWQRLHCEGETRRGRKYWHDVTDGSLNIYLPNIESEAELNRIVFSQLVSRYGLRGLMGAQEYEDLCISLYKGADEKRRMQYMSLARECFSADLEFTAGELLVFDAARMVQNKDYFNFRKNIWTYIANRVTERSDIQFLQNTIPWRDYIFSLAGNLTDYQKRSPRLMSNKEYLKSLFLKGIDELIGREDSNLYIDRSQFFELGLPSDLLASCSSRLRDLVIEFQFSALYGWAEHDERGRFVRTYDATKRDKHRFPLSALKGLHSELEQPLAVFASKNIDKYPETTIVMCHGRVDYYPNSGKTPVIENDMGNIVLPITPRVVYYDREYGRRLDKSCGREVNNIDSVYPKEDFDVLRWLALPGVPLYLSTEFQELWLKPTLEKYKAFFKSKKDEIQRLQTEREAERAKKPSTIQQSNSAEDRKRWFLLDRYREFGFLLKTVTKVVKEFENPKIISRNRILFSVGTPSNILPSERTVVEAVAERIRLSGVPVHIVPASHPVLSSARPVDGRRALGFTDGREIFLSEDGANVETTVHEYTHVWAAALQISQPERWSEIVSTLKETKEWNEILSDAAYAHLKGDESSVASEVLARLSGQNAREVLLSGNGIEGFWDSVSRGIIRDERFSGDIQSLTERILADCLSGKPLISGPVHSPEYYIERKISDALDEGRRNIDPSDFDSNEAYQKALRNYSTIATRGIVLSVTHPKPDSDWAIATLGESDRQKITITGNFPNLEAGMRIEVEGHYDEYKGQPRLVVESHYPMGPDYLNGVRNYIATLHGISEGTAERLVKAYDVRTLDVLESQPAQIIGISRYFSANNPATVEHIDKLSASLRQNRPYQHMMVWLMQYGITENLSRKIIDILGDDTIAAMKNPYTLTRIDGVGFRTADNIAAKLGFPKDSKLRIAAGLHYALSYAEKNDGSTCLTERRLINDAMSESVLGFVDENGNPDRAKHELVENMLHTLLFGTPPSLYSSGGRIYHKYMLDAERNVAERITGLLHNGEFSPAPDSDFFLRLEARNGIQYSERQKEAVVCAATNPLAIITGGPGTGKTTVVKAVIEALQGQGFGQSDIALAAPTGKAAKRMSEQTGFPASTIHRLLEYTPEGFGRHEEHPIGQRVVIVDESSMIDVQLMSSLLSAVNDGSKLIIIGDSDQLPSVGAGKVLSDFIESGVIPTVRLDTVHRQGKGSAIIDIASLIRNGAKLPLDKYEANVLDVASSQDDFVYVRVEDANSDIALRPDDNPEEMTPVKLEARTAMENAVLLAKEILPSAGISPDDIQILSPSKVQWDPASTTNMNAVLREAFNPHGEEIQFSRRRNVRVGDKVILTKNHAAEDVFNGDQGRVVSVNADDMTVTVDFDGRLIVFDKDSSLDLLPSYAITIHKSQGSEFPVVIIPLHSGLPMLLQRQLIYTAVTRGKRKVILVGSEKAIDYAVNNNRIYGRYSNLVNSLRAGNDIIMPIEAKSAGLVTREPQPLALSENETAVMEILRSALLKAGITLNAISDAEGHEKLASVDEGKVIRFTDSKDRKAFQKAINDGVVNRGLSSKQIFVFNLDNERFNKAAQGESRSEIQGGIINNLSGIWTAHAQKPGQFFFSISKSFLQNELLSDKHRVDIGEFELRTAIAHALPEIIAGSVDVEIVSRALSLTAAGTHTHRLIGAIKTDGQYYRTEILCSESPNSFSLEKIHIHKIAPKETFSLANDGDYESGIYTESIVGSELLQWVTKLSDDSKYILSESKKADPQFADNFINGLSATRSHLYGRAYGWVEGEDIFITRDGLNPFTSIKNYTHLWAKAMQLSSPKSWEAIRKVVKSSDEWKEIMHESALKGAYYNEDFIVAEALSRISAKANAEKLTDMVSHKEGSSEEEISRAVGKFWGWTDASLLTDERFFSVRHITDRVLYDLVNGTELFLNANNEKTVAGREPEGMKKSAQAHTATQVPEDRTFALDEMTPSMLCQWFNSLSVSEKATWMGFFGAHPEGAAFTKEILVEILSQPQLVYQEELARKEYEKEIDKADLAPWIQTASKSLDIIFSALKIEKMREIYSAYLNHSAPQSPVSRMTKLSLHSRLADFAVFEKKGVNALSRIGIHTAAQLLSYSVHDLKKALNRKAAESVQQDVFRIVSRLQDALGVKAGSIEDRARTKALLDTDIIAVEGLLTKEKRTLTGMGIQTVRDLVLMSEEQLATIPANSRFIIVNYVQRTPWISFGMDVSSYDNLDTATEFSIGMNSIDNEHYTSEYSFATEIALFLAYNLNEVGIKTSVISEEKAREVLAKQYETHPEQISRFRLPGGNIYGYQQEDTIYLTPSGINPNTPIHEYAHLWAKVYEKLHPDEWDALKAELKTLPQWHEIASSESYVFIHDENRLAGEVLATIVGDKGKELLIDSSESVISENPVGRNYDETVIKGAEYFRAMLTEMAVSDVFKADGMERTGEVTLKVLRDFAEGKVLKVSKDDGNSLAAIMQHDEPEGITTSAALLSLHDDISRNGISFATIKELETITNKVYEETVFERLPRDIQQGLRSGGRAHVTASLLCRAEESTGRDSGESRFSEEEVAARQTSALKKWAQMSGLWHDNYEQDLISSDHPFYREGGESRVFDDGASVIKLISTSYYSSPQELLDRISLHNAFFESTRMEVIGFGRDSLGRFCTAVRQPFIIGHAVSKDKVTELAAELGQKLIESALSGNDYSSKYIYLADLNDENVIEDPEGNLHVIDCDIRLNTPQLGLGGQYHIIQLGSDEMPISLNLRSIKLDGTPNFNLEFENIEKELKNNTSIMANYRPQPIDTSNVPLSQRLKELAVRVAKASHENWMNELVNEGEAKGLSIEQLNAEFPNLKPWNELASDERASSVIRAEDAVKLLSLRFGEKALFGEEIPLFARDEIIDAIAENTHEVWAKQRMDEGWTYGDTLDDDAKKDPLLKPYKDLTDSEKEYGRTYGRLFADELLELQNFNVQLRNNIFQEGATWKDAFMVQHYASQDYMTKARIDMLMSTVTPEQRKAEGFYYDYELTGDSRPMVVNGRITLTDENKDCFSDLKAVAGSIHMLDLKNAFKNDSLQVVTGNVVVDDSVVDLASIEMIGGSLRLGNGDFTADVLTRIDADLFAGGTSDLLALALRRIDGSFIVDGNAGIYMKHLDSIGGDIKIDGHAVIYADTLKVREGQVIADPLSTFRYNVGKNVEAAPRKTESLSSSLQGIIYPDTTATQLSSDTETLRKAALFVAWETRDDNPYEFVVDLSKNELTDFLKASIDKLNREDKGIVDKILAHEPGYGDDYVSKRISRAGFQPDIEKMLVDDLTVGPDVLTRSMFFIATLNMSEEQINALRDSVKEKTMAYYNGIEASAPNVSLGKTEKQVDKLLNIWFNPWCRLAGRLEYHLEQIETSENGPVNLGHIESEARGAMADVDYAPYTRNLLGWIYNMCADYGLDYSKLPKDLQDEASVESFKKNYPELIKDIEIEPSQQEPQVKPSFHEPESMLQWMSINETDSLLNLPASPGKNALERLYESGLFMAEVEGKKTLNEIKEEFREKATQCRIGITVGPDQPLSLKQQLREAYKDNRLDFGDTILIHSEYTGDYGIIKVTSLETPLKEGDDFLKIGTTPLEDSPVLKVSNDAVIRSVEYRGIDDRRPTYNFSEDGSLLSISMKDGKSYSLPNAIADMCKEVAPELKKMNYFELCGLQDQLVKLKTALVPTDKLGFEIEPLKSAIGSLDKLTVDVSHERLSAQKELLQYIDRGERTNNTIIDRVLNRQFFPSHPLPNPDDIKAVGIEKIRDSVIIDEAYANRYAEKHGLNLFPDTAPLPEKPKVSVQVVQEGDLTEIPGDYERQMMLTGRINGPVKTSDGDYLVIQRSGNKLIGMTPDDIQSSIFNSVGLCTIDVEGEKISVDKTTITNLSYGIGQYVNDNQGKKVYIVYDLEKHAPVKSNSFEQLNREYCSKLASEDRKLAEKQQVNLQKSNSSGISKK